jgi:hypothetical protein
MARWSVSQPCGIGARGYCAPPPTGQSCIAIVLAALSSSRSIAYSGSGSIGSGHGLEHHGVGEAGHRGPVASSRLPAVLALALKVRTPSVDRKVRDLIRQMNSANLLWGAPRIHDELLKLGIEVSQATFAKYVVRRVGRPSPTWRSFLRNEAI